MLGFDTSETTFVTILDVKWIIGLIPLAKFDELTDAVEDASRPFAAHLKTHITGAESDSRCGTCAALWTDVSRRLRPAYREAVRWGLRDCEAQRVKIDFEKARLAGRDYEVVDSASVDLLSRLANGALIQLLAMAILKENQLSPDELLGFK